MQFYILAWKRSFDFSGDSSRQEFWWFLLVHIVVTVVCIWADVGLAMGGWFDVSYSVLSLVPTLAAIVRRLHDIGKSGLWGWVFIVPIIGPFWLAYLLAQPTLTHMTEEASA